MGTGLRPPFDSGTDYLLMRLWTMMRGSELVQTRVVQVPDFINRKELRILVKAIISAKFEYLSCQFKPLEEKNLDLFIPLVHHLGEFDLTTKLNNIEMRVYNRIAGDEWHCYGLLEALNALYREGVYLASEGDEESRVPIEEVYLERIGDEDYTKPFSYRLYVGGEMCAVLEPVYPDLYR